MEQLPAKKLRSGVAGGINRKTIDPKAVCRRCSIYVVQALEGQQCEPFGGFTTHSIRTSLLGAEAESIRVLVGAWAWPSPVGLAVAEIMKDGTGALRTVSVAPSYRRCGIGTRLLHGLQQQCGARGLHTLSVQYMGVSKPKPELARLLARCGWTDLVPTGVECISTHAALSRAPWMKHTNFPRGFHVLPWREIPDSERKALLREQRERPWVPDSLDPFKHLASIDLPTSQALCFQGRVIGWCINRRTAPRDLYCTSLFVREEYQARGHAIRLLAYTLQNLAGMGIEKTAFDVSFVMQGMMVFFEKHMLPYMSSVRTFYNSSISLEEQPRQREVLQ